MEILGDLSRTHERFQNYHKEVRALEKKLERKIPEGRRVRCSLRLRDLKHRLIPDLVARMNVG